MSEIRLINDAALRKSARKVALGEDVSELISRMLSSMRVNNGIGLAANQIGDERHVFVLNIDSKYSNRVFINAEILELSGQTQYEEGCLSIPGCFAKVNRYTTVKLKFLDENFREQEEIFTGLAAIAVQHEMDHLSGKLYIDHLSSPKRMLLLKKYRSLMNKRVKNVRS